MPVVEPLSVPVLVAALALAATVVAALARPWWLWLVPAAVTLAAGAFAGVLTGLAALAVAALAQCAFRYRRSTGRTARLAWAAGIVVMTALLSLHLVPGFRNPVIIRDAVLSAGAQPYTQYINFDKGLAGAILLVQFNVPGSWLLAWRPFLRRIVPVVLATLAVAMAGSLALGYVRFDPRWTPVFWVWAPINLLLTCAAEEAFFRGFLQGEVEHALEPRRHGAAIAVATSAVLFGVAHAAGGWRYVLLATLAGAGYGLAFQRTGSIEASILTHFAVNATHFLLFTYPALA